MNNPSQALFSIGNSISILRCGKAVSAHSGHDLLGLQDFYQRPTQNASFSVQHTETLSFS